MTHVILACMRDEALFVVEWLAHHLALGFDSITVFTNDCSDGTDAILQRVADHAPVFWHDNPGPYEEAGSIQKTALRHGFGLPHIQAADWAMHIDADEYLNIFCGDRSISALTSLYPAAEAIGVQWRHFGKGGVDQWNGGSVLDQFTWAEADPATPDNGRLVNFKTIFRPQRFLTMGVHTPKFPVTGQPPVVVNTAGLPLPSDALMQERGSGYAATTLQCTWANACLHHHHVKSDDLHRLKHARGDANGRNNRKRRIGSGFYRQVDLNDVQDTSISHYRAEREIWEDRLRRIPGLIALEDAALSMFRTRFQNS
jgi:hypothetical protein